jgi:hypothetical protein
MNYESEAEPSEPVSAFIDNRIGGERREEGAGRYEDVAIRRGELAILKGAGAPVIYEMAVRCFLEMGRPAVLVDGGCQADPYEVAAIAKRLGRELAVGSGQSGRQLADGSRNDGRNSARSSQLPTAYSRPDCQLPTADCRELVDSVLRNIYVARAFTAHQMEALIVERLGPMVERVRPVFVGVLSIDALFRDDQLDRYEARIMQARCLKTLRRLARDAGIMVAATEGGTGRWGAKRWW